MIPQLIEFCSHMNRVSKLQSAVIQMLIVIECRSVPLYATLTYKIL